MRPPRTTIVLRSIVLLGLMLGGLTANASDPVPRYWTEMSFKDLDVSPFYWDSVIQSKPSNCKAAETDHGLTSCNLFLRAKSGGELSLALYWQEKEPSDCTRKVANHCNSALENPKSFSVRSSSRVAWIKSFSGCLPEVFESKSDCQMRMDREWAEFLTHREELMFVLHDIVSRIEFYAIPCSCGGVPVGGGEKVSHPPPPSTRRADNNSVLTPVELPPVRIISGDDPLGQGTHGGTRVAPLDGSARAMRRTGGFPAGVEVSSMRIFSSSKGLPPRDQRSYNTRFNDRIEYLNFELNLTYPQRSNSFPFDLVVIITRNGSHFTAFKQEGLLLETEWISSWHSAGLGQAGGGYWEPGSYSAEISVAGEIVASGSFEITAGVP